jgi:CRISPR-associated protein Cas5h
MAMFRKPYTTTSSMSFAFPPPTTIAGLISSIVGLENGAASCASNAGYWRNLAGTSVGVSIKSPVRWLRAAINFWNVKNPQKSPHIQVKHQFLSRPSYRIFVRNGIEKDLRDMLEKNSFVFTPCLGVAYALADISYVGCCDDEAIPDDEDIPINTVLPFCGDAEVDIDIEKSRRVFKEIVPFKFSEDRALVESKTVLYSDAGESGLVLRRRGSADVTRSMGEFVAWFPEW